MKNFRHILSNILSVFVLCILTALTATVATACGKSKNKDYSIDVSELAGKLYGQIEFEDELNPCRDEAFFIKYGIENKDDIVNQSTYLSTNATTEEISVVECIDETVAETVKAAFEKRVAQQKSTFASYAPAEVARLDNAVITKLGKYVILCITADTDKANEIIKQYK